MANVTPNTPVRALPNSSFNVPANFTNRGTGSLGTDPCSTTVRSGACCTAAPGCCARTPAIPQPIANNNHTTTHRMVRFMGSLLSLQLNTVEKVQIFFRVTEQRTPAVTWDGPTEL